MKPEREEKRKVFKEAGEAEGRIITSLLVKRRGTSITGLRTTCKYSTKMAGNRRKSHIWLIGTSNSTHFQTNMI